MTVEPCFAYHTQFYHYKKDKNSYMSLVDEAMCLLQIMNFSKSMVKSWNYFDIFKWFERKFKSIIKCTQNSNFSTKGVNYGEEHYNTWKSSLYLNLDVFQSHGNTNWTCNSNKTLDFPIFFQKFKVK